MASSTSTSPVQRFGGFEVDPRSRELCREGIRIRMQDQPLEVLLQLLARKGEVVTREELKDRLWPVGTFVDADDGLNTAIRKLREVLGDSAECPVYIETIPRRGYRFIGPVEEDGSRPIAAPPSTASSSVTAATGGETVPASVPGSRVKKVRQWLLVSAVVAVGLATVARYLLRPLPTLHISGYAQITHDGYSKALGGTDGSRLYFAELSPSTIAQVSTSGGEIVPITIAVPNLSSVLDVSPDGSNFLIASTEEKNPSRILWNVHILGGSLRRLGEGLDAAFSPDGTSVAYSTLEGDTYLVQSDGTGGHKLASVGGKAYQLSWSPDARKIRFFKESKLWEFSSAGSNLHEVLPGWGVTSHQCCGRWTPDGRFFLFLSRDSNIGGDEQIWALDERRRPFWQPHADPVQLTAGPVRWGSPIPGKDGKTIFSIGKTERGELLRFDAKTGLFRPFLGGISADGVSFSKDGKSVVYVSFPDGVLWKADSDGRNPVQLTEPPLHPEIPLWSPDGTQILFIDVSSPLGYSIYIVPSEGGSPRRLLPNDKGKEDAPSWSPDGHQVVFSTGLSTYRKSENLSILDLSSHQVRRIPGSVGAFYPRWSPDGRYIAAKAFDSPSLKIFDFKTQRWSALRANGLVRALSWSRDSQFIYFLRLTKSDQGVFRIRVEGGEAERVVDLKDWHLTGYMGGMVDLDPTATPLLLRDIGSDDIYSLTSEQK